MQALEREREMLDNIHHNTHGHEYYYNEVATETLVSNYPTFSGIFITFSRLLKANI